MRDLAIAALVPSANDAATALAVHVGDGSVPRVRGADEREGAGARPHVDATSRTRTGSTRRATYSSARDVDDAALGGAAQPVHPHVVDAVDARRSPAAASLTSTDDLIGSCRSSAPRPGTPTTPAGRRSPRSQARRRADHGVRARLAERGAAEQRPRRRSLTLGPRAVPPGQGGRRDARLRPRRDGLRPGAGRARGAARRSCAPCAWDGRSSSASSLSSALALPVARGQRVGEVRVFADGRLIAAHRSSPPRGFGRRRRGQGGVVRPPHRPPSRRARLVAVIVRKGSLRDRHRHPQRRARPLADRPDLQARAPAPREQRARARGRQGHQRRARPQAARRAGRRDRARRRAHGHAHRRGADRGVDPQRLRPDPGRVAHLDRRRRPDLGHLHRDQRVGPEGLRRRARDPAREAPLLCPRRLDASSSPARCPAASTRASTPTPCAR